MLEIASKVERVTVYRSGARITRTALVDQPATGWPQRLALIDLPLAALDQSLRVQLEFPQGGGGLVASDLQAELDWCEPARKPAPEVDRPALERQLRSLERQEDLLRQDIVRLEQLQPSLRPPTHPEGKPAAFPLEASRSLIEMRQKLVHKWAHQRQDLLTQIQQVKEQLRQIDKALAEAGRPAGPGKLSKRVSLSLRSMPGLAASQIKVVLSYEVDGARWAPSYTLRFDRDFTMAELAMRAHVCQSSGEDWKGVRLEVSTALRTSWKDLPELTSRRLGKAQAAPRKSSWRPPPPNTQTLFADFDRGPGQKTPEDSGPSFTQSAQAVPVPVVATQDTFPEPQADPFSASSYVAQEVVDPFAGAPDPFAAPAADPFAAQADPFSAPAACAFEAAPADPFGSASDPFAAPPGRAGKMLKSVAQPERVALRARSMESPKPSMSAKPSLSRPPVTEAGGGGPVMAYAPPTPPARPGRTPTPLGGGFLGDSAPDWDWQLSDDHYSYHLLYLPAPHESGRGRLRPQTALSACLRQWKLRYPEGDSGQVQRQLSQALEEAARAVYMGAPSGLRWAEAVSHHDYLYEGEVEVDIPSVHTACHSVPLLTRQLEAHLHWLVVPKVSCDVFRQARLELLPELALPAGPADVFAGKDYLSTINLQNMAPGETVKLGLGVEQSIKVVRNTHFKETTAGMMGGTSVLRHEVVVEASNQLSRDVRLEVLEALPVAANADEVKVKLESSDPPLENLPQPQPGQRWWLTLPAGQKASARLAYLVEMSSKLELVGGNRREA